MKCPDCIHFERCNSIYIKVDGIMRTSDEFSRPEICCWFKDKSKFIELPCEVGETVYKIVAMRCEDCNYDDTIQCSRRDRCPQTIELHSFSYEDIPWFGKKVFLTREEAEKASKERENNA